MEPTPADHRRFRCLVAQLDKLKVTTLEQAMTLDPPLVGYDFAMVCKAVDEVERKHAPRWTKSINQLLKGRSEWKPTPPSDWLQFEDMRLQIAGQSTLVSDRSGLVWSPVEAWVVMTNYSTMSGRSCHYLRSLLTDEVYYHLSGSYGRFQIEPDGSRELVRHRDPIGSSISSSTNNHLFGLPVHTLTSASELVRTVIDATRF